MCQRSFNKTEEYRMGGNETSTGKNGPSPALRGICWENWRQTNTHWQKESNLTLLFMARFCYVYLYICLLMFCFVTYHSEYVSIVRWETRQEIQSHCTWAFKAREYDHTLFFRRTTKNLVAFATIWSLTLSPAECRLITSDRNVQR